MELRSEMGQSLKLKGCGNDSRLIQGKQSLDQFMTDRWSPAESRVGGDILKNIGQGEITKWVLKGVGH